MKLTALILLFCAVQVLCIPQPKCKMGTGMVDPTEDPYGTAKPGDCKKCAIKHCLYCTDNYKSCDACSAGYGFGANNKVCKACADPLCGECEKYNKCTSKKTDYSFIPAPSNWTAVGKKVSWDPPYKSGYCPAPPGLTGTGYSSTFTVTVKGPWCYDCQGEHFRPETDGDMPFYDFMLVADNVARSAWSGISNCDPKKVKFALQSACVFQGKNYPFTMNLVLKGTGCGKTKIIAAMGGGVYNPTPAITAASKWTYAVKA